MAIPMILVPKLRHPDALRETLILVHFGVDSLVVVAGPVRCDLRQSHGWQSGFGRRAARPVDDDECIYCGLEKFSPLHADDRDGRATKSSNRRSKLHRQFSHTEPVQTDTFQFRLFRQRRWRYLTTPTAEGDWIHPTWNAWHRPANTKAGISRPGKGAIGMAMDFSTRPIFFSPFNSGVLMSRLTERYQQRDKSKAISELPAYSAYSAVRRSSELP
jgi:hypothetical protein